MRCSELITAFITGGIGYVAIELVYRGRSDFSMAPADGICFMLLHALFVLRPMPLAAKCIAGAVSITAVEFLFGWVVNIRLGRSVWDYSNMKFNLYGQICLRYSCFWGLLTVPVSLLSKLLHQAARHFSL